MMFFLQTIRTWTAAALVIVSVPALAACSSDRTETKSDTPVGKPAVALIMKSLANDFFMTMAEGAEAHQAGRPDAYELIVNGIRNERDLEQQIALVEQMIARRVDAIVIAPADSRALVPPLKRARSAGIVVINIDNRLDAELLVQEGIAVPFVGPDNRAGARMVGEALAAELDSADTVVILEGIPTAYNARQRRLGFEDAMRAAGIEVVDVQSAQWEQAQATEVTASLLDEHPGLDGILASNDNMALGAEAAVRQAGMAGAVKIVGFDNIGPIQEMLLDGRIVATADQHADRLAVFGIEFALQILRGETMPGDRQTPVDLVTATVLEDR